MPKSLAQVEASERGSDLEFPHRKREDGERPRAPTGSLCPLSPELRVLPCGFSCAQGEGLESITVKHETLFLVYWIFQCKLSHISPPSG